MKLQLVRAKGAVTIVETPDGSVCRAVPSAVVQRLPGNDVDVPDAEFARGIEHGIRWDELTIDRLCVPVAALRSCLHQRGLRAAADIAQHPRLAREAVLEALGDVIGALVALDREQEARP